MARRRAAAGRIWTLWYDKANERRVRAACANFSSPRSRPEKLGANSISRPAIRRLGGAAAMVRTACEATRHVADSGPGIRRLPRRDDPGRAERMRPQSYPGAHRYRVTVWADPRLVSARQSVRQEFPVACLSRFPALIGAASIACSTHATAGTTWPSPSPRQTWAKSC